MENKKYVPTKETIAYCIAACGQGMVYGIMSSYISDFYLNVMLLSPIFVLLLMFFARIWDAINDPIMGYIVDHSNPKKGKIKSYLLYTPLPIAILTLLLFFAPNVGTVQKMIYATVTYVAWGMTYTACDVPFWSLPNALTPNAQERGSIISLGRTVNGALEKLAQNDNVALVDNNEPSQSIDGILNANVKYIIDHHKIKVSMREPVYCITKPVGCTATILYELYKQNDVKIDEQTAGLMLSAIISDTLLFKSPTCTIQDIKYAEILAKIAKISNIEKYGREMLTAGADHTGYTPFQMIEIDTKEFSEKDIKFEISQINTIDMNEIFQRQDEFEKAINAKIKEKNLDLYVCTVTDIFNAKSKIIALGEKQELVEKAFGVTLYNNTKTLENVVSRKKQILPNIMDVL